MVAATAADTVRVVPGTPHALLHAPESGIDFRGKIVELEGLRGLAILMVTIHHFWPRTGGFFEEWSPVAHLGWIGVDLFFVISGFLIGGILLDTRSDGKYFSNFYARRVLRIFPLYYALLLLLFIVVPVGQMVIHGLGYLETGFIQESGSPLWYFLFAGNIREAITGTEPAYFLAPLWSISIEEQFYLLCPLLIRHLDTIQLKRVLIGFMVLSPLFRLAMLLAFPDNERIQYLATISRLDNLSVGVWLALLLRSGGRLPAHLLSIALPALTALGLVIFASGGFDRHTFFCRVFGYSFLALYFLVAVSGALRYRGSRASAFLRMRWLVYLGGLCYGLYILQRPAEVALTKALTLVSIDLDSYGLPSLLAKTLFAVLVSHLSFRLLESPINRLKSRFASMRHPLAGGGQPVHIPPTSRTAAVPADAGAGSR
ncbi:acyltransferase family protein [Luteimonas terricola]|uniref:Acyltransferase n=1 Tax=Luteimonas terricola TaxID=645597 RepID=A0ABQ2EF61_9GAMM|nr:acyltransferase [Luteimonas terricola]GGK09185.1 acyltransferase [Luteimonas terricola]